MFYVLAVLEAYEFCPGVCPIQFIVCFLPLARVCDISPVKFLAASGSSTFVLYGI
jgi:hypothetical protein